METSMKLLRVAGAVITSDSLLLITVIRDVNQARAIDGSAVELDLCTNDTCVPPGSHLPPCAAWYVTKWGVDAMAVYWLPDCVGLMPRAVLEVLSGIVPVVRVGDQALMGAHATHVTLPEELGDWALSAIAAVSVLMQQRGCDHGEQIS